MGFHPALSQEADSSGSEAEENGEGNGPPPPRLGSEHQQEIRRHPDRDENPGLHMDLPAVALPASSRLDRRRSST
jgi:hypothetical protein